MHYADLSNFWSAWLPEIKGLGVQINTTNEAVIARKQFPGAKSAKDYQHLLEKAFHESARVLKKGRPFVLTFHNREPRAWVALFVAAARAGFTLSSDGVFFQDGVRLYKHTAQSRRAGSAIGDFVLPFKQDPKVRPTIDKRFDSLERAFVKAAHRAIKRAGGRLEATALMTDIYVLLARELMDRALVATSSGDGEVNRLLDEAEDLRFLDSHRRSMLERYFHYDGSAWSLTRT